MPLTGLDRLPAYELVKLFQSRGVSPVEATVRALERLSETEPSLNAFVTVDREGALERARRSEARVKAGEGLRILEGVPISVKDLIDVAGLRASYGSLTLKDAVARHDAPSVERIRAAGAIIIGKTATSEFGYRGYTKSLVHGNTANPWDLSRTPGGSSGGAVASVAAGVTPLALGTDGGGSVRAPAAFTGLVGIKASFGRVPVWPASATPTLAHVGPIARNVEDAARLLRVIAAPDIRDPFSLYPVMEQEPLEREIRNLRVAFSPTLGYGRVDADVAPIVGQAVDRLRAIWPDIETVEQVCPDPAEILSSEFIGGCSARLGDLVGSAPEQVDPPLLEAIRKFREMGSDRYSRIMRRRVEHREVLRRFFEQYDVLLTPTTPCIAWELDRALPPGHEDAAVWSYFTYPFNLGHQPAGTLPVGLTDAGLPVGLQFVTQILEEPKLIASMRLSEALGFTSPTPVEAHRGE